MLSLRVRSRDGCLNQRVRDRGKFICSHNRILLASCPRDGRWHVLGHLIISSAWLSTIRAQNWVLSQGPMASKPCQSQADSPALWLRTNHSSLSPCGPVVTLPPFLKRWRCHGRASPYSSQQLLTSSPSSHFGSNGNNAVEFVPASHLKDLYPNLSLAFGKRQAQNFPPAKSGSLPRMT